MHRIDAMEQHEKSCKYKPVYKLWLTYIKTNVNVCKCF